MEQSKNVIGPADCVLFKEVSDRLRYSEVRMISVSGGINEIIEKAKETQAKFIFYEADKEDADLLPHITNDLPSEPFLFLIAKENMDTSHIREGERARIMRLPANPLNIAAVLRFYLRDKTVHSAKEREDLLEAHIAHTLSAGCITPDVRGFHFLRDALLIVLNKKCQTVSLNSYVYAEVAKKRNTTVGAVDHGIRFAIRRCWNENPTKFKARYFGIWGLRMAKAPTPKEFLMTVAEGLRRELIDTLIL